MTSEQKRKLRLIEELVSVLKDDVLKELEPDIRKIVDDQINNQPFTLRHPL